MGTVIGNRLGSLAFGAALALHTMAAADGLALPHAVTDADYGPVDETEALLGRDLFFDPILSGNRNISCASCHHPRFATSDGLPLGLGEGGIGLGPDRRADPANLPEQRIPRNSPALFNLGAHEFTRLFHDGRIEVDETRPSGLRTPMEEEMVTGFVSILSAQTMFPVLSPDEMAGHYSENDVSKAVRSGRITGPGGAWEVISARVAGVPEYRARFNAIYPEIAAGRAIAFTDISNAIAAFIAFEWRSDTSHFDAVLRGTATFSSLEHQGAAAFYGSAGCSECHSGPYLTDHGFHAMGAPQIGPGKAERFEAHSRDEGRFRVTGKADDRFAFRTPSLRNVMQTGPWGHAGGHSDLRSFIADHVARGDGLAQYRRAAVLPDLPNTKPDWVILDSLEEVAAIATAAGSGSALSEADLDAIVAFLATLSDPAALRGRLGIPETVPSRLPVDR